MFSSKVLPRLLLLFVIESCSRSRAVWFQKLLLKLPQRSPSETVREFYKALRERKFREAFSLSIYSPRIEPLKPQEFEDLRPDFEKMALAVSERIPEKLEIMGETNQWRLGDCVCESAG